MTTEELNVPNGIGRPALLSALIGNFQLEEAVSKLYLEKKLEYPKGIDRHP